MIAAGASRRWKGVGPQRVTGRGPGEELGQLWLGAWTPSALKAPEFLWGEIPRGFGAVPCQAQGRAKELAVAAQPPFRAPRW